MEEVGIGGTKAIGDPTMGEVSASGDPVAARSPRVLIGVKQGRPDARGTRTTSIMRYSLCVRSCSVGPWLRTSSLHIISSVLHGASRSLESCGCWWSGPRSRPRR
ncbi:hypothetical protein BDA96_10G160800 [Sorghum bicolor]|uniref:Uncharacterized protein n=2 Tax=Sorghum bicolor TaxID=4558 RepID=A0A921Q209_SORBI|nr:hypothetical protein BDA96_10G160800 [Sorghum bicolor]KAG0514099.1 hypothetical protein BDA96_10G160800 [Sorghum bicolor]KXG19873.1 hypothetical protein SORBI_3010G128500 [Sorghum bicolor]OQU76304.1 hypothetical protein SORBI_3010G128500 [Sorghum bicolor]